MINELPFISEIASCLSTSGTVMHALKVHADVRSCVQKQLLQSSSHVDPGTHSPLLRISVPALQ